MTELYAPAGQYLWDFWLAHHEGQYHLFHLQAPRTLPHPEDRHRVASVGHATSTDLARWTDHGTALSAGPHGDWDDASIWTGSIIDKDRRFYMLYTGRNHERPEVQKIGLAISDDLFHWRKHEGNPVIVADGRWYETVGEPALTEAWRDPHLHYDEATGFFYAFITARANSGPPRYRGCMGAARSEDLLRWEVIPPVCSPHLYAQMETPQLLLRRGRCFLTFCTWFWDYSPDWAKKIDGPQTGLHAFVSDELLGEYRPVGDGVVLGTDSNLYDTRIVVGPKGDDLALSWCIRTEEEPEFAGRLSLPIKVEFTEDGLAIAPG